MTMTAIAEGRCTGPQCRAFMGEIVTGGLKVKTHMKHEIFLLPLVVIECHHCGHENSVAEIMKAGARQIV